MANVMSQDQLAQLAIKEREGIEATHKWTDADEEEYQREEEVRRVQWEMNQY